MALSALPVQGGRRGPQELWDLCRNSLGIALEEVGLDYDGDLELALARVGAPRDVWELQQTGSAARRLAGAERAVGWFASYLRRIAPDHTWAC
jgi:hypothetical protein